MSWLRGLAQRARVVLRFSRVERELARELRDHLDMEVDAQLRQGLPIEEARRRAALRVGHLDSLKEEVRDERGGRLVTDAIGDLRIAWRGLRRAPGFTLAVVLSLALGAGGTTAIFSVVRTVLLQPLPYPDADRLHQVRVAWNDFYATLSAADVLRLREQQAGVAATGAFWLPGSGFTLLTPSGPDVIQGANVTPDLVRVLGVAPMAGRLFGDDKGAAEVLIGQEMWRERFSSRADVLGRSLTLDGAPYTIVGVMPAGFNVPGQSDGAVWRGVRLDEPTRRGPFTLNTIARLDPGVTAERAQARLTGALTPILRDRYRADPTWRYDVRPVKDALVGNVRPTLLLLAAAVCLVMLIAIVNVANLLLARGTARARELAVRASLGAGRGRLARQLLAESALLGLFGGLLGLGLAAVILNAAGPAAKTLVPRMQEVRLDAVVVAFAPAVGALAGLLAGLLPVLRLPWGRLGDALRDGGRGAGESPQQGRARRLLVAAEIALTLTVLTGAALLVKSLIRLQTVDPGFRAADVLTFRLSLPADPYDDNHRLDAFLTTLDTRLRALPGVATAAYGTSLPPNRGQWTNNYTVESDRPAERGASGVARWLNASPDYFAALGIPILHGRTFGATDDEGGPPVAIVSQSFARRHFPDGRVLGRRLKGGDWRSTNAWTTVVGVVGDVPYETGMLGGVEPTIYMAHAQNLGVRTPYVALRTNGGDPHQLVEAVRQAVLSVDANVPLRDVAAMADRLHASAAEPRFRSLLFSLLAGVALVLAITGIYGVMAYHVNQRRRETAIRRALGARPVQVVGAVVTAALWLTSAGVLLGLAGAFLVTRSLSGVLYDVRPRDPSVFLAAAGILMGAALLASLIPAIRAARIDPLALLREE